MFDSSNWWKVLYVSSQAISSLYIKTENLIWMFMSQTDTRSSSKNKKQEYLNKNNRLAWQPKTYKSTKHKELWRRCRGLDVAWSPKLCPPEDVMKTEWLYGMARMSGVVAALTGSVTGWLNTDWGTAGTQKYTKTNLMKIEATELNARITKKQTIVKNN